MYKLRFLAISEFDKGNLCLALKWFQEIKTYFFFFFNITFNIVGGIEGNLNTIGTATLNSLGLKEKAGLMPRGENELKLYQLLWPPFP